MQGKSHIANIFASQLYSVTRGFVHDVVIHSRLMTSWTLLKPVLEMFGDDLAIVFCHCHFASSTKST